MTAINDGIIRQAIRYRMEQHGFGDDAQVTRLLIALAADVKRIVNGSDEEIHDCKKRGCKVN